MFKNDVQFKIVEPMDTENEPIEELERLRSLWKRGLQEGFESKLLPVFRDKERYFYVWRELSKTVKPCETIIEQLCIVDDLSVARVTRIFTLMPGMGFSTSTSVIPMENPIDVGLTAIQVVKVANRIIGESSSSVTGGETK